MFDRLKRPIEGYNKVWLGTISVALIAVVVMVVVVAIVGLLILMPLSPKLAPAA